MSTTTLAGDSALERRFIIGTLALERHLELAAEARVLLGVEDSISDCARLTADMRALVAPLESSGHAPELP